MTIIVTGGAGFIGSNFIAYLLEHNPTVRVVCLDALTYAGNTANLAQFCQDSRFRFVQGDICNRELVMDLFRQERPTYVVNFAAETHVDRSIVFPELFLQSNIIGVSVLMDACRYYAVKRFHHISTDEVYGDLPLDRPTLRFTEESPIRPSSPYSSSKAGADLLVLSYHRTYNLDVTISRCSNNYGPHQFPEKLIPRIIARALSYSPLPVYGTGANIRDWIHVQDHCSAIHRIMHSGKAGQIYNIGASNEICNLDLVKMICRELDRPESLIHFVADRRGHDLRYAVNSEKIHRELGWTPKIQMEYGLRQTISWYVQNRAWWEAAVQKDML